ncbi:MAG: DUF4810 domain-containing protein [Marinifilaceae bacterium]|jgi:hypothetical protein|nr:DUF4810 domain-containing protein [Marinifilaceae bacterium]
MKKLNLILSLILAIILFSSCSKNLYKWGNYEKKSFAYYDKQTPESRKEFVESLKTIIISSNRAGKKPAPGIYAEYGYLLFMQGKKGSAINLLKKEIEAYPESKLFVDRILKAIQN